MKKSQLRFEMAAIAGVGVFAAVFLIRTYEYGRRAALFPRAVSFVVLFLLLFYVASRIRRYLKGKASVKDVPLKAERMAETDQRQGVPWTLTFFIAVGFLILIYLIGFAVAAVCYMAAHIYLAGYRNHKVVLLYALVIGMALVLFEYLFDISLPKGILVEMIRGNT